MTINVIKKSFLILLLLVATACQQQMEPSVENINAIFQTQDFQIKFMLENDKEYRMGFLNNEMAFFSDAPTYRKELSYDDVRLINTFVETRFRESELQQGLESKFETEKDTVSGVKIQSQSQIEIYNDARKVVFSTTPMRKEFEQLLTQLELPHVPTNKK